MFAIDHAATALLLKRRYPSVSIIPMLIAVHAMELAWVAMNYLGVERTTTEPVVRSVADVHLSYMPYSHSIVTVLAAALLSWALIEIGFRQTQLGRVVAVGILSHLVLDLLTHAHDIAIVPGLALPKLGLGLYDAAPLAAFAVEMLYGIVCWWIYRGRVALLAVIVAANLANLSLFSAAIPGPEGLMAGRPLLLVTVIFAQIVVTLILVGILSRPRSLGSAHRGANNNGRPSSGRPLSFMTRSPTYFDAAARRRISPAIVRTRAPSFAPATSLSTCCASAFSAAARAAPLFISARSSADEMAVVRAGASPPFRTN